jgi:hypothetical protein
VNAATKVEEAARWRLAIGESLVAGGFAWIAFPRPQVSLLFIARRPHLVGFSDRRLMIWARPHEVRPAEDQDLVLDAPFADVTLEEIRTFSPMLQLRLATASGRKLVLEFRPRDRKLGHQIAEVLGGPVGTKDAPDGAEPPSTEVPAASS